MIDICQIAGLIRVNLIDAGQNLIEKQSESVSFLCEIFKSVLTLQAQNNTNGTSIG